MALDNFSCASAIDACASCRILRNFGQLKLCRWPYFDIALLLSRGSAWQEALSILVACLEST